MKKNDLVALLAKEGGSTIEDMTRAVDKYLLGVESEKETSEETAEEEPPTEETEETSEEASEETTEEEPEEESEETSEEENGEEPADESTLMAVMNQLAEELKALREENASLKAQLAAKNKAEAEFAKKFQKLSVSLSAEPKKAEVKEHEVYTDGIGE